jgi:ElaB/YqjD/DUF883 family membrane-anchored ribosome-binding protein
MSILGTIGAVAGIGSSIAGGMAQSGAATKAANTQATAAQQAQELELQNQNAAQGSQATALQNVTSAEQPYQALGSTSANNLAKLLQQGFTAPTLAQAEQTPGYQFNLQQGTQAINENAAATGNLLSGNTGTALEKYGQGLATTTYQQAYQNALNQYQANYQSLLGGTQAGLQSTGQLASTNQAAAQNYANIDLTGGQQQASQINNAAAARASGYIGSANAQANMFNGIGNSITQGALLNGIYGGGGMNNGYYGSGGNTGGTYYPSAIGTPNGAAPFSDL